jgi:hypothetical protein
LYIPRNQSEIKLQNIVDRNNVVLVSAAEQWTQLDAYINNSDYFNRIGQYAERNAARTPWNHQVIKIIYETKFHKNKLQFAF